MKFMKIPGATITRLSIYTRNLEKLASQGVIVVSSKRLAELCRVNPAQIRKDLAYFGQFGVRGVGYTVKELMFDIKKILGLNKEWNLAIVGLGNLGRALVAHENFVHQGYNFVAAFDLDPNKVGKTLPGGVVVSHADQLTEVCQATNAEIGVICTPPDTAQMVADQLMSVPLLAILNFAPVQLECYAEGCKISNVDFTITLDNLAYHLTAG